MSSKHKSMSLSQISQDYSDISACVSEDETNQPILNKRSQVILDQEERNILYSKLSQLMNLIRLKSANVKSISLENLQSVLGKVFLDLPLFETDFNKCTFFEKRMLQLILERRFKPKKSAQKDLEKEAGVPFTFGEITELVNSKLKRRRNDMFNFIIRTFIKYQLNKFKKTTGLPTKIDKKQKLRLLIDFFECHFPEEKGSKCQMQRIISSFIKINFRKNKHLKEYFGENLEACRSNFRYGKCVSLIRESQLMKRKFEIFLKENNEEDSPIMNLCKKSIKKKLKKKVMGLKKDFINQFQCSETNFLSFLKKEINERTFKLPMLMRDVKIYSKEFLKKIQNHQSKLL